MIAVLPTARQTFVDYVELIEMLLIVCRRIKTKSINYDAERPSRETMLQL